MKERPILFSAPMVRALLDGNKTQTRRVVKGLALEWLKPDMFAPEYVASPDSFLSPYGFAGDRLWVRETFFAYGRWETRFSVKKGRDEWHFVDMTMECDRAYQHAVESNEVPLAKDRGGVTPGWWRRPAIFMPRVAARILLDITDVRIERLHHCSEDDAWAEGRPEDATGALDWYRQLWDQINAKRGYGWDVNPWVWVVEFKRDLQKGEGS